MSTSMTKIVGIVDSKNKLKVAFGQDLATQTKRWVKSGSTVADFVELPNEMTRVEALEFAKTQAVFAAPERQALLDEAIATKSAKPAAEKRVKAGKAAKPSLDAIKQRGREAHAAE